MWNRELSEVSSIHIKTRAQKIIFWYSFVCEPIFKIIFHRESCIEDALFPSYQYQQDQPFSTAITRELKAQAL